VSIEEAFEPVAIKNKAIAVYQTFGHLFPKKNKRYEISILFTYSEFGDMTIISTKQGKGLHDSPILFIDMNKFVEEHCTEESCGSVMLFTGIYVSTKDGGLFDGSIETVYRMGE
jgi:hypothetical protein